jgi:drug/metabolite transporter (DMT)-like permease
MTRNISGEKARPSAPFVATIPELGSSKSFGTSSGSIGAGIVWMLVTTFLFVCQDALARLLLVSYPATELAFVRYGLHMAVVTGLVVFRDPRLVLSRRPIVQLARSSSLLAATLFVMAALQMMPFVDVAAVVWVAPVLVTAMSVVLLGEHVGLVGWLAVLSGMAGVWVIVGHAGLELSWTMAIPALGALANALYQIATRMLYRADPPLTTLFYTALVGTFVCGMFLPFVAVTPTVADAWLMALLGALGTASHFCLIRAFTAAPANIVAPFGYTSLVWSTLFGVVLFAEIPRFDTIVGSVLIVGSGLAVFLRRRESEQEA